MTRLSNLGRAEDFRSLALFEAFALTENFVENFLTCQPENSKVTPVSFISAPRLEILLLAIALLFVFSIATESETIREQIPPRLQHATRSSTAPQRSINNLVKDLKTCTDRSALTRINAFTFHLRIQYLPRDNGG